MKQELEKSMLLVLVKGMSAVAYLGETFRDEGHVSVHGTIVNQKVNRYSKIV